MLVNENKVDYTDPPFLNRFEKQLLRYSDILNNHEVEVISDLNNWVKDFCCVDDTDFEVADVFLGFHEDTLASLVLLLREQNDTTKNLFQMCKKELLAVATPDGVLRSLRSKQYKHDALDVKENYDHFFFEKPLHKGLEGFIDFFVNEQLNRQQKGGMDRHDLSLKFFIMTHSSIHTDVTRYLHRSISCQVEKLGAFKSEKQLSKHIEQFWLSLDKQLLLIQCEPSIDAEHMSLMKCLIEQSHESYLEKCRIDGETAMKSIGIIVHLQRGEPSQASERWKFTFLRSWKQATIDALETPNVPINNLLGHSVVTLMEQKTMCLKTTIADQLMWCFTRLKYPQHCITDAESVDQTVLDLKSSSHMMKYLEDIVLRWINKHHDKAQKNEYRSSQLQACDWQVEVSCDKNALLRSSTLSGALIHYIDHLVRRPLAKVSYTVRYYIFCK